jgi:hypothetical protein
MNWQASKALISYRSATKVTRELHGDQRARPSLAEVLPGRDTQHQAVEQFDTHRIMNSVISAVNTTRLGGGIATAASV